MTDKERILVKIESLLNETNYEPYTDEVFGRIQSLKELKSYIYSMQDEPVSNDFEEALAQEWKGYNDRGAAKVDVLEDNTQELAFAKGFYRGWHYKKEKTVSEDLEKVSKKYSSCIYLEEVLSDDDKEVLRGRLINTFKAGAEWQKEQLMKDAIELPLYLDGDFLTVDYDFTESGFKVGDKVKLIIIKEE